MFNRTFNIYGGKMKKSLVMASLLALGTSAIAIDVQPFVGVNSGASWTKVKENGNIILISDDSQTPLVWGYDSKDYSDSYVNKWLNNYSGSFSFYSADKAAV